MFLKDKNTFVISENYEMNENPTGTSNKLIESIL